LIFQTASINAIHSIRRLAGDKTSLRLETLLGSQWLILRSLVQAGLEVVKVAAIILMVFGHIDYIVDLKPEFSAICRYVFPFNMPLFLIVSGFLFWPLRGPKLSLRKTLYRIVYP
jgi:hypothetical protein